MLLRSVLFSRVDTSNAMVLGSTGINIGIGITKPYQAKVTIAGSGNTLGILVLDRRAYHYSKMALPSGIINTGI
ncbi:MAG: hypothetical protein IPP96_15815 [Chitinophagaceae bacterium]|nr:hypothetical protein [Chitinophagaceae bacterium]